MLWRDSQDDEGGEGQAGHQAVAAAAQRAPVGTQAAPAPPAAPAVAETHPSHRHGHGEEQGHRGTHHIAQLILHHLCNKKGLSHPCTQLLGALSWAGSPTPRPSSPVPSAPSWGRSGLP